MASRQVRDILDNVRKAYHHLAEQFEDRSEIEQDERVQALLEHFSRHSENVNHTIDQYEDTAEEGILDTWIKYADDHSAERLARGLELRPDMTIDEIIAEALEFDRTLIISYRAIADSTAAPRVSEAFESLAVMSESEEQQFARSLQE